MVCETFAHGDSFVHRLDPRARVAALAAFAVALLWAGTWVSAVAALLLASWICYEARLPGRPLFRRLRAVNLFVLVLVVLLPLGFGGDGLFEVGPLAYRTEGLAAALLIALRVNAVVLAATALVSTMEFTTLGHALEGLRAPPALVHLLMFTVRYVDLLHHEYDRLRAAMRARCFRPRANRHTWRSLGRLVGMLLVRSFDRSERVVAAMKCRGYTGRFPSLQRLAWAEDDTKFCIVAGLAMAGLILVGG